MSDNTEPWGIIVTPTLHLPQWSGAIIDPACGDERVEAAVAAVRASWSNSTSEKRPIFGPADNRPVCWRCIAAYARTVDRLTDDVTKAEAWNAERERRA